MSELLQIFLTASLTIIGGVLIYVLGEITRIVFLNPFQEFKNVIAKIDNELKFYAHIIANPGINKGDPNYLKCSRKLRRLSCDLEVFYRQLPYVLKYKYSILEIIDSAQILIGLSNSIFHEKIGASSTALLNVESVDKIRKNLKIVSITG